MNNLHTPDSIHLRWIPALLLAALAFAGSMTEARADADSLATVGLSTRLGFQNAGQIEGGDDFALHFGLRTELLYVLGAEIEWTQRHLADEGDIYRPNMRLTGHLHMINNETLDLYLGVGLAASRAGDLVNIKGDTTMYRLGGGLEIIAGSNWAVGFEGWWNVAGVAFYRQQIDASVQEAQDQLALNAEQGAIPTEQPSLSPNDHFKFDGGHFELGLAMRYYF